MRFGHRSRFLSAILVSGLVGCSGVRKNLRKADGYLEDGRWSAAIRTYQQVLDTKPGEPRALMGVAEAWIRAGEPEKALVPAQVAAAVHAEGSAAALAKALLANGRGREAVPLLEQALGGAAPDVELMMLLAEARLAAEEIRGAVSAAEDALPAGGGARASSLAAWLHLRAGDCNRAIRLAARSTTAALDNASVQAEAAAVFRGCAAPDEASAAANTARALIDDDARVWFDTAARHSSGGDTEGALRRMSWLRAAFPTDGRYARELGGLWMALDEAGLAEANLRTALTLPPYADGAEVQGIHFADRRADALTPEQRRSEAARLWGVLAKARSILGDASGVAEALEMAAREARSTDADQWKEAAQAWLAAGHPARAIASAQKAVSLQPDHPVMQVTAAEAYARSGDLGRAIGHGRVAWNLEPSNLDTSLMLADLYLSRGENREARRIVEIALGHHPKEPRLRAALRRAQGY